MLPLKLKSKNSKWNYQAKGETFMKDKYNTELYHYGILGMKWHVRRTPAQLGHIVSAGHKKMKNDTMR